jgi:O-antigen/teichoic acid export membrane protein
LFQKIRELSKDLAIYGAGDVAVSIVNFLLLPLYIRFLTPVDYGVLAQLGAVEVVAKIVFRCGLDGSFMRFYYDYEGDRDRQRLASTIFFFLLTVNAVALSAALLAAPLVAERLFRWGAEIPPADRGSHVTALRLVLVNTFAIGFTFFPFHLLRMQKRSVEFSLLTLARSVSTLLLRLLLVMRYGLGVTGVVVADLVVTLAVLLVLLRWFAPLIRPLFSRRMLRESLAFGLPRVPHAFAQQVIAVGDRFILPWFRTTADIGVYSIGASFGLAQKLFLSAFEYAWAPFYYATSREPDGRRVFATVTTYAFAVLALMTAGLSAIAGDVLAVMADARYAGAAGVIAWTAVGVLLQGVYLLTSIGLNITKHTQYYPVSTMAAAGASVALNVFLIPRYGIIGAAWANASAYGLQAAIAFRFSQRFYPIDYEWGRLARVSAAALLGYMAAGLLPALAPAVALVARGTAVVTVMGGGLALMGFFQPAELRVLTAVLRRGRTAAPASPAPETTEFAGEIVASDVPANVLGQQPGRDAVVKLPDP